MFRPLAFTKTFAMASGAVLAVTIIPVLMVFFISERVVPAAWSRRRRLGTYLAVIGLPALVLAVVPLGRLGAHRWPVVAVWVLLSGLMILPQRIPTERRNPLSRVLESAYNPFFILAMRFRWLVIVGAAVLVGVTVVPLRHLGQRVHAAPGGGGPPLHAHHRSRASA